LFFALAALVDAYIKLDQFKVGSENIKEVLGRLPELPELPLYLKFMLAYLENGGNS